MGWLKKVRKKLKKFGRTKFGKALKIVGGVGLAAVGVGAGVKIAKGLKAAKAARGIGAKAGSVVKAGKGILGSKSMTDTEKKGLFGNSISRLSKKINRKAARKQKRIDRKQAKLDKKNSALQDQLAAARGILGSNDLEMEVEDKDWISEQKQKLDDARERFFGGGDSEDSEDTELQTKQASMGGPDASKSLKAAAGVGGGLALGWGIGKLTGLIK